MVKLNKKKILVDAMKIIDKNPVENSLIQLYLRHNNEEFWVTWDIDVEPDSNLSYLYDKYYIEFIGVPRYALPKGFK